MSEVKDLSAYDTRKGAEQGHEHELTDPATHEPLGVFITVIGADAPEYQDRQTTIARRRLNDFAKSRRMPSAHEADAAAIDLLAFATRSWRTATGNAAEPFTATVALDGKALAFTAENARMLYQRLPWIREQLEEVIQNRANFLPDSAKA